MNNLIIPDIAHLIETGKIENEYTVLKELEETIIDLYEKKSSSNLFQNDFLLLTKMNKDFADKINIQLYETDLSILNKFSVINKNIDNIVINGPLISIYIY